MTPKGEGEVREVALSPDRALFDPAEDRLGYAPFAEQLARSILRGCPADGLVVGLYGAWGTGKSTVLNFILHYLEKDPEGESPTIVRFNPWWFAGQEDLVRRFLKQFEASLFKEKAQRRRLLKRVTAFSDAVAAMPLPYVAGAAKAAKAAFADNADVVALKDELVKALAREVTRVVVVIDDVDRLAADEIRQLFQVVKAIADFPNVIYLLAFDNHVVVRALETTAGTRGEEYLEKIVQVPFTLPLPDRAQLQALFFERLDRLVGGTPAGLFDQQHWGNVYLDGIDPFIQKPRDVVRLVNALNVTYPAVVGEVNAVDFIAVETLRVFAPVAYDTIRANSEMFTGTGERHGDSRAGKDREKVFHDVWLKQLGDDGPVVQKLVKRLFPRLESVWGNNSYGASSADQWRKGLRVCCPEVFQIFFRLSVPTGDVSAALMRGFIGAAADSKAVTEQLIALAHESRADGHTRATSLLSRLQDHLGEGVPDGGIEGILTGLFDAGDEILGHGKKTTSVFDLGDEIRIGWAVQALLGRIDRNARGQVLARAIEKGRALATMAREVTYLGSQHGKWGDNPVDENERLVSGEDLEALERILQTRIAAAAADGTIWMAAHPVDLLEAWRRFGDADAMRREVSAHLRDDAALVNFVSRFVTRVSSHGMTDRVSRMMLRFDPQYLETFVDIGSVAGRLDGIRKRGALQADQNAILDAFARGKKARDAGKDPMRLHDFDGKE